MKENGIELKSEMIPYLNNPILISKRLKCSTMPLYT